MTTTRATRAGIVVPAPVERAFAHDRWVSKYAEPRVAALSELKNRLERTMEKVYEIYTDTDTWRAAT